MKFHPHVLPVMIAVERAYPNPSFAQAYNLRVISVAQPLDAHEWRDVIVAAREYVHLDITRYVLHDKRIDLPFLVRLTDFLLTPNAIYPADEHPRLCADLEIWLSEMDSILASHPDLPWELAAAWAGLPEPRFPIPRLVLTGNVSEDFPVKSRDRYPLAQLPPLR